MPTSFLWRSIWKMKNTIVIHARKERKTAARMPRAGIMTSGEKESALLPIALSSKQMIFRFEKGKLQ